MSQHILYGVGKSILRDFKDATKIIALSKLKNLEINATSDLEKIYAGDSPYPLATFPKEKSITVSAENGIFDMKLLNATQGANVSTGQVIMSEVETVVIPADGVVTLKHDAITDSVYVDGFTVNTTSPTQGEFQEDGVNDDVVNFNTADAGQSVNIVYEWQSSANAETIAIMKDTLAKPFKFIHRIPIHDENSTVVAEGQLTIYKARANNNFSFGLQPQTAFAPKIELQAEDPQRPDGKLWDFTISPVS